MYTYKVVNAIPQWKGLNRIPIDLENLINFEAAQGWRLFQIVPNTEHGYTEGHIVVFVREI